MDSIENRKQYDEFLAKLGAGEEVTDEVLAAMVAFAKAKKIKRPARPRAEQPTPSERKSVRQANEVNKGKECSVGGCETVAVAKGMCSSHYTRLVHRAQPENRDKAREASRRYATRKRIERSAEREKGAGS